MSIDSPTAELPAAGTATSESAAPTPLDQKLLLVTSSLPGPGNVGALFLGDLCRGRTGDEIAVFGSLLRPPSEQPSADLDLPTRTVIQRKLGGVVGRTRVDRAARRHLAFRRQRRSDAEAIAEAIAFGRSERANAVWAVLNTPQMCRIGPAIADGLSVPLYSTVLDPPEGVAHNLKLDRLSRSITVRDFDAAVAASDRVSVISERMQSEYRERFGDSRPYVVVRHGIAADAFRDPAAHTPDPEAFTIGFGGSLYDEREWKALLAGLDRVGWRLDGRPVRIRFAGGHMPKVATAGPSHVEYLGWRAMAEVVDLMAGCDVCYLPVWLSPAYVDSARLSFATKLTTYLTAGRPVLYHGPRDAAVMDFFERYPVAAGCHSRKPEEVAAALERIASEPFQRDAADAIRAAVADELNLRVFTERFEQFARREPVACLAAPGGAGLTLQPA